MAEDLGEITIKFGEGGGGGGPAGPTSAAASASGASQQRNIAEATKAAMSGIISNIPAITRVAQAGMQGGGLGSVVSASRMAAGGIAGAGLAAGAVLAPLLAVAAGVGVVAVAVSAIRSFTASIVDRVGELARVSAPMAMQDALNKISEMRRDMREARVLGPMYTQVSQLVNKIKDLLQPFLMAFRAALLSVIIPMLEKIVKVLEDVFAMIPEIATFLDEVAKGFNAIGGAPGMVQTMGQVGIPGSPAATGVFQILSWLFPASGTGSTSTIGNTLSSMASTLMQFYNSYQKQQTEGTNGWALGTLNALASGQTQGFVGTQPVMLPVRTNPTRRNRPQSRTP